MDNYRFFYKYKSSSLSFIIEAENGKKAFQKAKAEWGDKVEEMTFEKVELKK